MWKLTLGDVEIREGDLTLGQAERIEELTGESWRFLNPLRSAKHAVAIASVFIADREQISVDDARTKVSAANMTAVIESYEVYDDIAQEFVDGIPTEGEGSTTS